MQLKNRGGAGDGGSAFAEHFSASVGGQTVATQGSMQQHSERRLRLLWHVLEIKNPGFTGVRWVFRFFLICPEKPLKRLEQNLRATLIVVHIALGCRQIVYCTELESAFYKPVFRPGRQHKQALDTGFFRPAFNPLH